MNVLVNFARYYATTKHAGQLYGGSLPYTHHLAAVEAQVVKWNPYPALVNELRACAWLHDTLEDCGVKLKEIEELFGHTIGRIVWLVTDAPGDSRQIRHALTYPQMRKEPDALFIKLCDRIANVEQGGSLVQMYAQEYEDFYRALYTEGQFDPMWIHLRGLLEGA